ncbi:metallophosphoesterase [Chenggangzhangella methanolivorans]|uniref:metallophosphoesterase n=1 Tax=Chenggangzhangella methanolivorans TaxID=1437009 RepID=UPI003614AC3C
MFSDLHVDVNGGLAVPLNLTDCDAIIVAGDVCERLSTRVLDWLVANVQPAGVPVIYLPGNHDFYHCRFPAELDKAASVFESAGVTLLARGETTQVRDVTVVGATLWTDFQVARDQRQSMLAASDRRTGMNDHRRIRFGDGSRPFLPADAIREHAAAVEAITRACKNVQPVAETFSAGDGLADPFSCKNHYGPAKSITSAAGPADSIIVVTHHAPSPRSLRGGQVTGPLDAAYASDLEALIEELQPAAWVHGHVHRSVDYRIGATRVVSNPMGYLTQVGRGKQARMELENPAFDPSITITVGAETPPGDLEALRL